MAKCTGVRCPMQHGYNVNECNHTDCPYRTEPMTNADRIRAMSDEELAEFICGIYDEDEDYGKFIDGCFIPCYDQYSIKEWLEQTAEGD